MDKIGGCLFQTTFVKICLGYVFHIAIKIIIQKKKKHFNYSYTNEVV